MYLQFIKIGKIKFNIECYIGIQYTHDTPTDQ